MQWILNYFMSREKCIYLLKQEVFNYNPNLFLMTGHAHVKLIISFKQC